MEFVIAPILRFKNTFGVQYTMFFIDPFDNPIEFKRLLDINKVFIR